MSNNKVSLIVPAYNEEMYIGTALNSAREQTRKPDEILVIANGCTDNTADYVYSKHQPGFGESLRVFEIEEKGISLAKNYGIERASGNIIAFLDADSQMTPKVIEEAEEALSEGNYAGAKARIKFRTNEFGGKALAAYANFCNAAAIGASNLSDFLKWLPQSGTGAFMASKAEVLEKIKDLYGDFFDEGLETMEDADFTKRMRQFGELCLLENYVITSARRYDPNRGGKGYLKGFIEDDLLHYLSPEGKERKAYR